ncbi:DciA family protein [Allorhizocola rhizosphaerae]|uniref:DciA family protein n=1 Tax=Allorhizocola rhizosphaerae TaxID=1872709 RepID=UPI001FE3296F|nr:DciA family protein [Allorhizocola rhizosphaerae]
MSDEPKGPELARAALEAALRNRASRVKPKEAAPVKKRRGYSGAGPDPRDPAKFSDVLANLVKARGWERPAAEATLFGAWETVVGPDIAGHSRPMTLSDGELTIEAESTAWATQLRLLNKSILTRIASVVGHNVVTKLRIHGPAAPARQKGQWRVRK